MNRVVSPTEALPQPLPNHDCGPDGLVTKDNMLARPRNQFKDVLDASREPRATIVEEILNDLFTWHRTLEDNATGRFQRDIMRHTFKAAVMFEANAEDEQ